MVQGSAKFKPSNKKKSESAIKTQKYKSQLARKGNPLQLPKNNFRDEAVLDKQLSRAIDKSNEQKVAAKLIQDGGRITLNDVMTKGKELNRDNKRKLVKRKIGRVEEKLNLLKAAEGEMDK